MEFGSEDQCPNARKILMDLRIGMGALILIMQGWYCSLDRCLMNLILMVSG